VGLLDKHSKTLELNTHGKEEEVSWLTKRAKKRPLKKGEKKKKVGKIWG